MAWLLPHRGSSKLVCLKSFLRQMQQGKAVRRRNSRRRQSSSRVLSHGDPRTHDTGRRRTAVAAPVGNRADDGTDHRQALVYSVRPGPNHIAFVVVNPFFTAHDALPLKANGKRIAVGDRPGKIEFPPSVVYFSLK